MLPRLGYEPLLLLRQRAYLVWKVSDFRVLNRKITTPTRKWKKKPITTSASMKLKQKKQTHKINNSSECDARTCARKHIYICIPHLFFQRFNFFFITSLSWMDMCGCPVAVERPFFCMDAAKMRFFVLVGSAAANVTAISRWLHFRCIFNCNLHKLRSGDMGIA